MHSLSATFYESMGNRPQQPKAAFSVGMERKAEEVGEKTLKATIAGLKGLDCKRRLTSFQELTARLKAVPFHKLSKSES
jgi:hypothetical protein